MTEHAGLPDYPSPRYRAAIVQHGGAHEECVPALAHLLLSNGVEPTIYLAALIAEAREGFEDLFPHLRDRVRYVRFGDPEEAGRFWEEVSSGTDLLVMNTFRKDRDGLFASQWAGPMLGLVHNAKMLQNSGVARGLVETGRIGLLTLAPHVTAQLMLADPRLYARTATVTSAFPVPPATDPARPGRRSIALPGSVSFLGRDYVQLLDALPAICEKVGRDSFGITVVGGSFGGQGLEHRARLQQLITERGLADLFTFARFNERGLVPGSEYYAHLRAADFLLPPISPEDPSYRTIKITSAIPTSVGLGIPAIIDRWTATVYGVPAVTHELGAVIEGVHRALATSDEELAELRRSLHDHKVREFDRAQEEMAWALASVGLGA